jgi:hypothetical protein
MRAPSLVSSQRLIIFRQPLAVGTAGSESVGTIALKHCDRRAAGTVLLRRAAQLGGRRSHALTAATATEGKWRYTTEPTATQAPGSRRRSTAHQENRCSSARALVSAYKEYELPVATDFLARWQG